MTHLKHCCDRLYSALRMSGLGWCSGPGLSIRISRVISYDLASLTLKWTEPTTRSPLFAASGSGSNRRACLACVYQPAFTGQREIDSLPVCSRRVWPCGELDLETVRRWRRSRTRVERCLLRHPWPRGALGCNSVFPRLFRSWVIHTGCRCGVRCEVEIEPRGELWQVRAVHRTTTLLTVDY